MMFVCACVICQHGNPQTDICVCDNIEVCLFGYPRFNRKPKAEPPFWGDPLKKDTPICNYAEITFSLAVPGTAINTNCVASVKKQPITQMAARLIRLRSSSRITKDRITWALSNFRSLHDQQPSWHVNHHDPSRIR